MTDIRWEQRYEHYQRALSRLAEALAIPEGDLSDLEREGLIQRFEYTFELAWKVLRDYLDHQGNIVAPHLPARPSRSATRPVCLTMARDGWLCSIAATILPIATMKCRSCRRRWRSALILRPF